jgi:hypothetical protein
MSSWLNADSDTDSDPEKTSSIHRLSFQVNGMLERLSLSESDGQRAWVWLELNQDYIALAIR